MLDRFLIYLSVTVVLLVHSYLVFAIFLKAIDVLCSVLVETLLPFQIKVLVFFFISTSLSVADARN